MYYHYGKWDPVFRGCPLLGGNIMYYHYGSEVVLFLEVTNVLSLWEVGSCVQRLASSRR